MYKIFWSDNLKDKEHLEDLSADERITLNWALKKYGEITGWKYLVQERGEWLELE
jgi:hypothetical protein